MAKKLYEESSIQGIANAIRAKNGSSDTYTVGDMATAIQNIPTGGGDPSFSDGSGNFTVGRYLKIKELVVPSGFSTIPEEAFKLNSTLESVILGEGVRLILNGAFSVCTNLKTVTFPSGISLGIIISKEAFSRCTSLVSFDMPNAVTDLGNSCFSLCENLEQINLSTSLTNLPNSSFANCTKLQTIDIPSGVSSMGAGVLSNCTSLHTIISRATTPPTLQANSLYNVPATCPIYVPAESVEAYKTANNWSARADYIQAIPS